MTQKDFLINLCEQNPNAIIIGSIGTISYDLTDIPHKHKIFLRGAMGSAMSVGLGYAIGQPKKLVIVVIGDGSFLMCMGHISTILKHKPHNLKVIIIKNNCYQSCGGQKNNFESIENLLPSYFQVHEPYI